MRMINGIKFETVVDRYVYNLTNNKKVVVWRTGNTWTARILKPIGNGHYMDGSKENTILKEVTAPTLKAAAKAILTEV